MLKFVFFLLVLANAGLFAYQQGHLDAWIPSGREPARMKKQIQPELVKVLPQNATSTTVPAASTTTSTTGSEATTTTSTASSTATTVAEAKAADPAAAQLACVEIGNFAAADATRFETQLASLNLGQKLSRRNAPDGSGFIVFMPPQGSKEAADKKVGQLRALGVTDFFVIQDNSDMRWAISLGLFTTEQAAKARLAKLSEQGVRTARIGPHSGVPRIFFQLHDLDAATRDKVEKIRAAFPQQQSRACGSAIAAQPSTAPTP